MLRIGLVVLSLATSFVGLAPEARAEQASTVCLQSELDLSGVALCKRWGARPAGGEPIAESVPFGVQAVGWTPPEGFEWGSWWAITPGRAGQCFYREGGWFPDDQVGAIVADSGTLAENDLIIQVNRGTLVACTVAEIAADPGPPAMVDPQVVFDAVEAMLPRSDPQIPPGRAITGLPMWLVTNRALTFTVDDQGLATLPGGLVDVTAEATFMVDWGDDTIEGPFDRVGIPYNEDDEDDPDGIRHYWTDRGDYTITVTDTWTVSFTDEFGRSDQVTGDLGDDVTIPAQELVARLTND